MFHFISRLKISLSLLSLSCILVASSVDAVEFTPWEGLSGAFDTTLSLGTNLRVQDRSADLIGRANGGTANSINFDRGDLNWDKGATALALKATHELSLTAETAGFFTRFNYFYDFVNSDTSKINDTAERYVGHTFNMRDLYVYKDFDEMIGYSTRLKVGNQVLNWGESTFILNGINSINPIDVSSFRVPGAEVRDALLPIPAIDLSFSLTDNLSFEGFYQFAFEETKLEAFGSYFSTNNFASPGGNTVFLGFADPQIKATRASGAVPGAPSIINSGVPAGILPPSLTLFGSWVPRSSDKNPSDQGEYGFATRFFSEALYDTEFGFYYTNLHSRLPLVTANLATLAQFTASPSTFANNSNYFLEFPKHIKTLGTSFATDFGSTGISLAGEVSHKFNQPLQIHSVDLLQAALAPAAVNGAAAVEGGSPGATVQTANLFNTNPVISDLGGINNTSPAAAAASASRFFGTEISGYKRKKVTQAQMTAIKLFGPFIGANQWVAIGELGVVHIHNFPSKSRMRFDASGLYLSGNSNFINVGGMPAAQPLSDFPDATSYGYRLLTRFDYLDVWDGINLFPSFRFSHDFKGTTPNPLGTFIEDRKAFGAVLTATYLEKLSADIGYNHFFGAGSKNLVGDRDFVSLTVRYSF